MTTSTIAGRPLFAAHEGFPPPGSAIPPIDYAWNTYIDHALTHPDKPSIVTEDGPLTASEVLHLIEQLLAVINEQGIRRGDRIMMIANNSPLHLVAWLCCLRVGAVFVPIQPRLAPKEHERLLALVDPRIAIVDGNISKTVHSYSEKAGQKHLCSLDSPSQSHCLFRLETDRQSNRRIMSDDALMLFSSGTTGKPHGVLLTWENLYAGWLNHRAAFGYHPRGATMAAAPLSHVGGFNGLTNDVFVHGGVVAIPSHFHPATVVGMLKEWDVESFFAVPTMLHLLCGEEGFTATNLPSLRAPLAGGSLMDGAVLDKLIERGFHPIHVWGMTETAGGGTSVLLREGVDGAVPIGIPMAETVVELEGSATPRQIHVRGRNVASRFWPEEDMGYDRSLPTSDLAELGEDGLLYFAGRSQDVIVSGGENIIPLAVEEALKRHPDIIDCLVCAIDDELWGQKVGAVVISDNPDVTLSDVRDYCQQHIARFKLPTAWAIVDAIPTNATGKPDRAQAAALIAGREAASS